MRDLRVELLDRRAAAGFAPPLFSLSLSLSRRFLRLQNRTSAKCHIVSWSSPDRAAPTAKGGGGGEGADVRTGVRGAAVAAAAAWGGADAIVFFSLG